VPPIDRSPLMLSQGTSATSAEKVVITDFNQKLAAAASAFKANHTGVSTWLYDSNSAFTTILNSPTQYGFVDATSYGSTGDFWGNNYHPSSAAQVIFGQQIGSLLASTVW
jgi:phospholipase/lecithinase/hemolysin